MALVYTNLSGRTSKPQKYWQLVRPCNGVGTLLLYVLYVLYVLDVLDVLDVVLCFTQSWRPGQPPEDWQLY